MSALRWEASAIPGSAGTLPVMLVVKDGIEASGGSQVEASAERSIRGSRSGGSTILSASKPPCVEVELSGGSRLSYE